MQTFGKDMWKYPVSILLTIICGLVAFVHLGLSVRSVDYHDGAYHSIPRERYIVTTLVTATAAVLFAKAARRHSGPFQRTAGLILNEARDAAGGVITGFQIQEGSEQIAAWSLLQLAQQGYEVCLRNELDEGREGCTFYRQGSSGYERMIGGHGWQSAWELIAELDAIKDIVSLASLSRAPEKAGSIVQNRR